MENDLKQQNTEFAKQALNNLENLKMTIQFNINKIFIGHLNVFLFNKF